jgi:hypothetical protein
MRTITKADVERIVGAYVQPLFSGLITSVSGMLATLSNVTPFGSGDLNYRQSFPFGLVSQPVKGVMAYILNLTGSALAPVILSHLDKNRPTPSAPGETMLYSLPEGGGSPAIWLRLRNDGTFELNNGTQEWVNCQIELLTFLINARTTTLLGPQPLFDVTTMDTLLAIKTKFETFQEGG